MAEPVDPRDRPEAALCQRLFRELLLLPQNESWLRDYIDRGIDQAIAQRITRIEDALAVYERASLRRLVVRRMNWRRIATEMAERLRGEATVERLTRALLGTDDG